MIIKQHRDSATKKLSIALLLSAAFIYGCGQEASDQQPSDAAAEDLQQIEHPKNAPISDTLVEEGDASVLEKSSSAQPEMAQYGTLAAATAEIKPASGSNVSGSVNFKPGPEGKQMQVDVQLAGLGGEGQHGIHVHEIGDCSAADAASAGGHFNPYNVAHGAPGADAHHVGDMGNITADAQGEVDTTLSFDFLTFSGPANILNKAVVVHSRGDDLKSDPAGKAGERVGCGVVVAQQKVLPPGD